ncbi:MAG TPA: GNAT family N-acetyltransferase [Acidimicrobiales bacterium]|jgi:L-amino acid N-acyltransferase YncA|nr:GNAT family N-acetyltransferase [Acidimicrobiales bacterium]
MVSVPPSSGKRPTMAEDVVIRDAERSDLGEIVTIYNDVLVTTSAIWTEQPTSVGEREQWLDAKRAADHPVLVAVDASGVLGFVACGPFRDWPGYAKTIEHSIHVRPDVRGRGVGRLLLATVEDRARSLGMHVMVAATDASNEGSIRFHQRAGFVEVGRMPEVGRLRGAWRDLVLIQKILAP